MWADFSGKPFTREQFAAHIAGLKWSDWKPIGITLHNTASPTLAQWAESGPAHDARIRNLQSYYEGMGWHGGPHLFISRDWINEFSNPLRRGTHSRCYNATHLGIEMVGDYNSEQFSSGDGAKVRDNAVFAMAVFCRKFGFNPDRDIVFHKDCKLDNHDCPGKLVSKLDIFARVKAEMARQSGQPAPRPQPPPAMRFTNITATEFGGAGDEQPSAYADVKSGWPNRLGVSLPARFPAGPRPLVRVWRGGKSIECPIVDVGPWNGKTPAKSDRYWETGKRPQAESGTDLNGRKTNLAGIDLTPAAARALGLQGKGKVDWEFVQPPTAPKTAPVSTAAKVGIGAALAAGMTLGTHWIFEHWLLTGLAFVIAVAWLAIYFVHRREEHP